MIGEHKCKENITRNEVWPEINYEGVITGPWLTLVGHTLTGSFEHSERINFCPYCGADLRIRTGCGVEHSGDEQ